MCFCLALAVSAEAESAGKVHYRLVAFGDSLTAGYGLKSSESFPVQLQSALRSKGYKIDVENAGVSGDTTAGGLARLDWSIADNSDGVILELGANDALRGIAPASTRKSLEQIIIRLKKRNIDLILTGMLAPPNLGQDYGQAFDAIFPELARKHDLVFFPFFLQDVAGNHALNQPDGLHPTAQGIGVIVGNILPKIEILLRNSQRYGIVKP